MAEESEKSTMVDEDLEDGEIESDGETEDCVVVDVKPPPEPPKPEKSSSPNKKKSSPESHSKSKSSSSSSRKDKGNHDEDDFMSKIENALAENLKKSGIEPQMPSVKKRDEPEPDNDRRPSKKSRNRNRKRRERKEQKRDSGSRPKRAKVSDNDGLYMVGGSPDHSASESEDDTSYSSYDSDEYHRMSYEERRNRRREKYGRDRRDRSRDRERDRDKDRNRDRKDKKNRDTENEVCLRFSEFGHCPVDDCTLVHEVRQPKKMELCKFWLMECCAKRDKCSYMHGDFPCKYYYLGMKCVNKDCKFMHGKPLSDSIKAILLKHLDTAPKEILGDFPRIGRENATKMMAQTHIKLCKEFNMPLPEVEKEKATSKIPSLLDMNLKPPEFKNDKKSSKGGSSRWMDHDNSSIPQTSTSSSPGDVILASLRSILSDKQIESMAAIGVITVNHINNLTVAQLNDLGLSLATIGEIQATAMNMEKKGGAESGEDVDLRKDPRDLMKDPKNNLKDPRDPGGSLINTNDLLKDSREGMMDPRNSGGSMMDSRDLMRDPRDIMRDPRDLMRDPRGSMMDPRNSGGSSMDTRDPRDSSRDPRDLLRDPRDSTRDPHKNTHQNLDVDMRVIPETIMSPNQSESEDVYKKPETPPQRPSSSVLMSPPGSGFDYSQYLRDSNLNNDDETEDEPGLKIDENYVTSDYEAEDKKDSEESQDESKSESKFELPLLPPAFDTSNFLKSTTKIDISSSVSQLMEKVEKVDRDPRSRDPRMKSPKDSPKIPEIASPTYRDPRQPARRTSIYEIESPSEDEDVKLKDKDMRLPTFLENGDVDLRFPFTPMANYVPATEIEGSYGTHIFEKYEVKIVDVPKPDYSDIKKSFRDAENTKDPRLLKLCGLLESPEEPPTTTSTAKTGLSTTLPSDPRKRKQEAESIGPKKLQIATILRNSNHYNELSSSQKMVVNEVLAELTKELKIFHANPSPNKTFDTTFITQRPKLQQILIGLGVFVGSDGEFEDIKEMPLIQMPNIQLPPPMIPNLPPPSLMSLNQPPPNFMPNLRPGLLGVSPGFPIANNFDPPDMNFGQMNQGMQFNDQFNRRDQRQNSNFRNNSNRNNNYSRHRRN